MSHEIEKTRAADAPDSVGWTSEYVQIDAQDQNWSKIKFRPDLDYRIE